MVTPVGYTPGGDAGNNDPVLYVVASVAFLVRVLAISWRYRSIKVYCWSQALSTL